MKMNRWIAVLGSVALLSATAACGGSDKAETGGEVTVGVLPLADYAAVYWAEDHGFFEKEGLDVTVEPLQGGPVGVQKVISGELEFSFSNTISSTIASSKGAPVQTVALTSSLGEESQIIVVKPNSPIKDMDDLDGKTVGVNTLNNIGDVTFKNLAKSEGVDADPEWVEVPFPEMIDGVRSGSLDAGYVPEPFAGAAKAAGLRQIVNLSGGPNLHLPAATFVTSLKFAKTEPETVEAFQRALNAASADIATKEDEFRAWLPTVSQTPAAAAATMNLPQFETEVSVEKMQRVADILIGLGLVEDGYDAADSTFVARG